MDGSLGAVETHEAPAASRLAPDTAGVDPRTLANWWRDYRQGFHDGADHLAEQSRSYAYLDGHDRGYDFRQWISATREYVGEPHFPGWNWEYPNQIPAALRSWARGREATTIKLARYGRGGDRRSAEFKANAGSAFPPV